MTDIRVHETKARSKEALLDLPGVVEVGVGDNEIVVGTDGRVPSGVPEEIEGVPVRIDTGVGTLSVEMGCSCGATLDTRPDYERKYAVDPIVPGVSIGHFNSTAGTAGPVMRTPDGEQVLLSNNHVLAQNNNAKPGDSVHQPGPMHSGNRDVGELLDFVPVESGGVVDTAWARIDNAELSPEAFGVDAPRGDVYDPDPGDTLVSTGITSGVSSAEVGQVDATVRVDFGGSLGVIQLEEQIITRSMSGPGDSGSLVTCEGRPAGVLFAGSENSTIVNSAENVVQQTGLEFVTLDERDENDEDTGTGDERLAASVTIEMDPIEGNLSGGSGSVGTVTVSCLDGSSGEPIEDVRVTFESEKQGQTLWTDANGEVVADVPVGKVHLTATHPGFERSTSVLSEQMFAAAADGGD